MQYLLMIGASERLEEDMSPEDMGALMEEYGRFTAELEASGAMVDGNRLRPVADASTVRLRDGKVTVTDGPFAETKEQIGGYYVIKAEDLDEAVRLAQAMPADDVVFEIRPIAFRPDA